MTNQLVIVAEKPQLEPLEITLEAMRVGHGHKSYRGRCGAGVTVEDIRAQFYDPFFGGRDARVENGAWSCVEHTD